jgi:hypothetical protein
MPLGGGSGRIYAGGDLLYHRYYFTAFGSAVTAVEASPAPPGAPRLVAWPNPFQSRLTLDLRQVKPGDLDVAIYDVAGRLIRRVRTGNAPAGEQRLTWDGRCDDGTTAGAGIYFVRARTKGSEQKAKIVRLK